MNGRGTWVCAVAGAAVAASAAWGRADFGPQVVADVNSALSLSASRLEQFTIVQQPDGTGSVDVSLGDGVVTLMWTPRSVRAPGFEVRAQVAGGSIEAVPSQPVRTVRGAVKGMPGSKLAGSVIAGGLHATLVMPDGTRHWIEPVSGRAAGAPAGLHAVYSCQDILAHDFSCAMDTPMADGFEQPAGVDGGNPEEDGLCVAELATDADFEYFQFWGGVEQVQDRIELIVNTVNLQYESEIGLTHVLTDMVIRTDFVDPYTQFGNNELLCEFVTEWTNNQQGVVRDVAHLFTGREVNGSVIGQATDLGNICIAQGCCSCGEFGLGGSYCFSQSDFNGNFGCATDLTAHELGHLWDGAHCSCPSHTMNPSIACANTFHPELSIPALRAFKDSIGCLDCAGPLLVTFPDGLPELINPSGGTTVPVVVAADLGQPAPGTGELHVGIDGVFSTIPMLETSPGQYLAVFPAAECGTVVEYFFSVETLLGTVVEEPVGAPGSLFSAIAGTGLAVTFADNFESNTGWTVANTPQLTDGAWDQGVPAGGGDRGDPPVDADGSGQCFLTDNEDGNSDVDGGATTLTSPVLDASAGNALISYWRWFDNSFGDNPATKPFTVEVSDSGGASWSVLEVVGPGGPEVTGGWVRKSTPIEDAGIFATSQFRIRFTATDAGPFGSVVEAGVDGVELVTVLCDPIDECPADVSGDGATDSVDLNIVLAAFGSAGAAGDANGDGFVDSSDLNIVLAAFGTACR